MAVIILNFNGLLYVQVLDFENAIRYMNVALNGSMWARFLLSSAALSGMW